MACVFSVPTLVLARSAAGGRERQRLGASTLVGRETTRIPTVVRLAATTSPPSSDPHRLRFHILSGTDGNIIFTPIGLVQHHCIIITLPLGHYFFFFLSSIFLAPVLETPPRCKSGLLGPVQSWATLSPDRRRKTYSVYRRDGLGGHSTATVHMGGWDPKTYDFSAFI